MAFIIIRRYLIISNFVIIWIKGNQKKENLRNSPFLLLVLLASVIIINFKTLLPLVTIVFTGAINCALT
jgi:hypothetical protein